MRPRTRWRACAGRCGRINLRPDRRRWIHRCADRRFVGWRRKRCNGDGDGARGRGGGGCTVTSAGKGLYRSALGPVRRRRRRALPIPVSITLNPDGKHGDLASVATAIRASGMSRTSARPSTNWGGAVLRLVVFATAAADIGTLTLGGTALGTTRAERLTDHDAARRHRDRVQHDPSRSPSATSSSCQRRHGDRRRNRIPIGHRGGDQWSEPAGLGRGSDCERERWSSPAGW